MSHVHKYRSLSPELREELNSNYLISSWSYSKVTTFARNQKAFEMNYVFGEYSKAGATTIAGQAYHEALKAYFTQRKEGKTLSIIELEQVAYAHIDTIKANQWKLQQKTPTVEECIQETTTISTALIRNFMAELGAYEDDIEEVLDVEVFIEDYLTVNGQDIPLPCRLKIDLAYRSKVRPDGLKKVVIADHKSKKAYSDDEEVAMSIGIQAITYALGYEAKNGIVVDEVKFIENKFSMNKNKSNQLVPFTVELDPDTRKLYEALLYEPLSVMLNAVSNPDHLYLINEADNFVSKAEIYNFWCRTQISEIEDFNVEEAKKEMVSQRLKKIRDSSITVVSPTIIKKFKANASRFIQYDMSATDLTKPQKIEHVLRQFSTPVEVAHVFEGYSSDTYLLSVSAGVKISQIYSHRLDIANALDVPNVRISQDLVVYQNKSYLAIDFEKKRTGNLLYDPAVLEGLRIPLGKDNFGKLIVWDLENHASSHTIVCGSTGSGKSVFIINVLKAAIQAKVKDIIIFDPKFEFVKYNGKHGIVVVNEIIAIETHLQQLVVHMNDLVKKGDHKKTLVIFDEYADAVDSCRTGKDLYIYKDVWVRNDSHGHPVYKKEKVGELKSLQDNLKMLAQKGRSSGFRILLATQRASVKVLSGDIKANFPVRVCFMVPKEIDSKVVLDEAGAETLAGFGDGLIKSPEYKQTTRFQAFYTE